MGNHQDTKNTKGGGGWNHEVTKGTKGWGE